MKEILLTEKEMVFLVLLYFHGKLTTQNDDINPLSVHPTKWSSTLNLSAVADELLECV